MVVANPALEAVKCCDVFCQSRTDLKVSSVAASGLQYALGQRDPHGGPAPKRALVNVELWRVVGGGHARVVRRLPRFGRNARVEPEPQVGVGPHEEECPGLRIKKHQSQKQ